jgi:hypothetical protein
MKCKKIDFFLFKRMVIIYSIKMSDNHNIDDYILRQSKKTTNVVIVDEQGEKVENVENIDITTNQTQNFQNVENVEDDSNIFGASGYDKDAVYSNKFNRDMWNQCEKPLSSDELKRCKMIMELGEKSGLGVNLDAYNKSKLVSFGDSLYLNVRNIIIKSHYIKLPKVEEKEEVNNEKKSKGKKGNNSGKNTWIDPKKKKDEEKVEKKKELSENEKKMIEDNIVDSLNSGIEVFKQVLKNLTSVPSNYQDVVNGLEYIEFRVMVLMKILELVSNQYFEDNDGMRDEILIGATKIHGVLKKIIEKQDQDETYTYFKRICQDKKYRLPRQLVDDLKTKIDGLKQVYNVGLSAIANRKPKLIFNTIYDATIPETSIKPHDSQIEVCSKISSNMENGLLMFYKTLTGLGKTTMIAAICSFMRTSSSKLKVIFCCSDLLESVRMQVLKMAYNVGIKFGIATYSEKKKNYLIVNHNNCHSNEERELIVADYKSTYLILKEHEDNFNNELKTKDLSRKSEFNRFMATKNKYLLFFDEPTVLTDNINNDTVLTYLSRILNYLPAHTILSSATLPLSSELSNLIKHYKVKYPNGAVTEVVSNKTLVGCHIKDFESNHIVPHQVCDNVDKLRILIQKIKNFPLIGKFYTLTFLVTLNDFMKKYNLHIDMDDISSFDQDSVFENIMVLLQRVADNFDEEKYQLFLKIEFKDVVEEQYDTEILNKVEPTFNVIDHSRLLTTQAFKFIGCCLIATENPEDYIKKHFTTILDFFRQKKNIQSAEDNYSVYKSEKKLYDQEVSKLEMDCKNDKEFEKRVSTLTKPTFEFPRVLEINSIEHMNAFSQYVKVYDKTVRKEYINHEKLDITEFNVDDDIKLLLQMGVGIFSQNIKNTDPLYANKVIELLSNRQLAFIITDESFCYGANYPISHVIINDDLGEKHSINTILQLIGRTSRIGKSWSGRVYLDKITMQKIMELFRNPTFNSVEGNNISRSFDKTIADIKLEEENARIKMELELKLKQEREARAREEKELRLKLDAEQAIKENENRNKSIGKNDTTTKQTTTKQTGSKQTLFEDDEDFSSWRDGPVSVPDVSTSGSTPSQTKSNIDENKSAFGNNKFSKLAKLSKDSDEEDEWGDIRTKPKADFVDEILNSSVTKPQEKKNQSQTQSQIKDDDTWSIVSSEKNKKFSTNKSSKESTFKKKNIDDDWGDVRTEVKSNLVIDNLDAQSNKSKLIGKVSQVNQVSQVSQVTQITQITQSKPIVQNQTKSDGRRMDYEDDLFATPKSTSKPVNKSSRNTGSGGSTKSFDKSADKSVDKPLAKPADKPVAKPIAKQSDKPTDKPTDKTSDKQVNKSDSKSGTKQTKSKSSSDDFDDWR